MIATLDRPPATENRDFENTILTLTPEEDLRVADLVEGAKTATNSLQKNIGELYLLLVARGERKWRDKTFKDVCQDNDYFKMSATSCYELGQNYKDRLWAIAQHKSGILSFDPENLSSSCFQALRRLEVEGLSPTEIEENKLEALEEALAQANLRKSTKNLSSVRVQENDIHQAIAILEQKPAATVTARPRRKKGVGETTGMTKKELELQAQSVEQGKQLRQEREQFLQLKAQFEREKQEYQEFKARIDREVEERVQRQLQQRLAELESQQRKALQERDLLAAQNEKLRKDKEQLEALLKRSPGFSSEKNSATVVSRTNQPIESIVTIESAAEVLPPNEIDLLVAKKQRQGFQIELLDEELYINGLLLECDTTLVDGLKALPENIAPALRLIHERGGEGAIVLSGDTYYWQFNNSAVMSGTRGELGRAVLASLGMTATEFQQAIAQLKQVA